MTFTDHKDENKLDKTAKEIQNKLD